MNKEDLLSSIKWNINIVMVNVGILIIIALVLGEIIVSHFSTLLLIEAAVAFLLGSAVEFSASLFFGKIREHVFHSEEKWSLEKYDKERKRSTPYIILGFFLLCETFIFSSIIG
jgi:uncharacterized oligopeptide transporter (OPT) family protein